MRSICKGMSMPSRLPTSALPAPVRAPVLCRVASAEKPATAKNHADELTRVSADGLPRSAVVGVLGGGQLGRMMALAAANMGVSLKVLDPSEEAPAAVAAEHVRGHFRDADAIQNFALKAGVDVLTMEIEHIDASALESAAKAAGITVEPTPSTIKMIQDKFYQKQYFEKHGVPLPGYCEIKCRGCMEGTGEKFGFPFMLKSKRLAYDGKGNAVVKTAADIDSAVEALGGYKQDLYAEKWAPFVKELAVMVVRSRDGTIKSYPLVETVHKDSICWVTEAPADVPSRVSAAATAVAEKAIACLEGAGIFGVEMFVMADGSVMLNEVAPRPHNSGHYTMNGCVTSQFENHVRAILGWPLGDTSLLAGSALMLNLIGEADGEEGMRIAHQYMEAAYKLPGASVHWYGKPDVTKGRKIGHINIVAANRAEGRIKLGMLDPAGSEALRKSTVAAVAAGLVSGEEGGKALVGIIMGSDSDLSTMKAAAQILEDFGVPMELTIVSAHRTPERMIEYARSAHKRGLKAIIAGAGGAAHLPGMVAALTPLPVIGVPVVPAGAYLDGMDALFSIVQMPKGVPCATVAIGNAANAALLAIRILGTSDPTLLEKMLDYQLGMKETVLAKAEKLEALGWKDYKA